MSPEKSLHTGDYASITMLVSAHELRVIADKEMDSRKPQFLVPSFIMAFTAIEAHVNQLIQRYVDKKSNLPTKEYIERQMGASIDSKLLLLTKYLTGKTFTWNSHV